MKTITIKEKLRLVELLDSVNETLDDLMVLIKWIQFKKQLPSIKSEPGKQTIIRGETDGTMGMENVKQLLNWNAKATLILSGGVYGREKSIGDIGAIDLYKHIEYDLTLYGYNQEEIKKRTIIDSFSLHTIDQGKVLAGILNAIDCEDVFIVIPLYHMPRFLLVLAKELSCLNFKPNIIPIPYGDWSTSHPRKGPLDGSTTKYSYYQLFVYPPTPSRSKGKLDCGEVDKIIECIRNENAVGINEFIKWMVI